MPSQPTPPQPAPLTTSALSSLLFQRHLTLHHSVPRFRRVSQAPLYCFFLLFTCSSFMCRPRADLAPQPKARGRCEASKKDVKHLKFLELISSDCGMSVSAPPPSVGGIGSSFNFLKTDRRAIFSHTAPALCSASYVARSSKTHPGDSPWTPAFSEAAPT